LVDSDAPISLAHTALSGRWPGVVTGSVATFFGSPIGVIAVIAFVLSVVLLVAALVFFRN
jgi:hypothetical protein